MAVGFFKFPHPADIAVETGIYMVEFMKHHIDFFSGANVEKFRVVVVYKIFYLYIIIYNFRDYI